MKRACSLPLRPLDAFARDGAFHALGDGNRLVVGRWDTDGWVFSSGRPLGFVPVGYYSAGSQT